MKIGNRINKPYNRQVGEFKLVYHDKIKQKISHTKLRLVGASSVARLLRLHYMKNMTAEWLRGGYADW